jgi:L-lactate dehydrogenase (cytochrome)
MRLRDYRNGMLGGGTLGAVSKLVQLATSPLWAYDVGIKGKPHNFGNIRDKVSDPNDLDAYKAFIDAQFDASITWDDIRWLRDQWQGTLLIKGVMEADDARKAVDAGADGVIVSNHGGRQLDGIASSISKVADVADAIGDESTVLMDGGVRNGIDVVKALALGADAVLVGRPWIYAMAASGEQGIVNLLDVFQREIATAMALAGVNRIEELSRETIETRA